MKKTKVFLLVAVLAVANYYLVASVFGNIVFNFTRIILAAWGGWYLVVKSNSKLYVSALVGVFVLVLDHVILKGGSFLIAQIYWPESVQNQGMLALGGVLVSFAMFAPVAALISLGAGFLGRRSTITR